MNGRMEAEQMGAEPVAWAAMDGTKTIVGYHSCDRVKAEAWAREYGFPEVAPLYLQPQPTLTDAEREFLQALHNAYEELANQTGYVNAAAQADSRKNAAIIRGLLARCATGSE